MAASATGPATASAPSRQPVNGADGSLLKTFSSMLHKPAVKACDYVPDASDDIDVELSEALESLRPEAASKLCLVRKACGSYDIAGRQVTLFWTDSPDKDDDDEILVVREDDMNESGVVTPVETYLEQTANVALFFDNKPRHQKNLTFGDASIPDDTDPFTARLMCMRLACDQAQRRQAHEEVQVQRAPQDKTPALTQNGVATVAAPKNSVAANAEVKKKAVPRERSWWERWIGAPESEESGDEDEDPQQELGCDPKH